MSPFFCQRVRPFPTFHFFSQIPRTSFDSTIRTESRTPLIAP
jgi:hypothetical protein